MYNKNNKERTERRIRRTENEPITRRKCRGVATGGRVGRYAPPASENFVFFERQNRKKYFFRGV
jgi:hypothetical protein